MTTAEGSKQYPISNTTLTRILQGSKSGARVCMIVILAHIEGLPLSGCMSGAVPVAGGGVISSGSGEGGGLSPDDYNDGKVGMTEAGMPDFVAPRVRFPSSHIFHTLDGHVLSRSSPNVSRVVVQIASFQFSISPIDRVKSCTFFESPRMDIEFSTMKGQQTCHLALSSSSFQMQAVSVASRTYDCLRCRSQYHSPLAS